MIEWITAVLIIFGASFMLLAAVGIVRMPDVWTRMHCSTKSATLGVGFIQIAVAISFIHDLGVFARAIIVIGFVFQTAPVAAHMIGRAAYLMKLPLWRETVRDDLKGQYSSRTHTLGNYFCCENSASGKLSGE